MKFRFLILFYGLCWTVGFPMANADVVSARPNLLQSTLRKSFIQIQKKMAVNASTNPTSYSYNPAVKMCVDSASSEGWNKDLLMDCGRFDSVNIQSKDLKAKSLKGLYLALVTLNQVNFDSANLTGATLFLKQMKDVSFRNANLKDTVIYCESCDEVSNEIFQGALINARTSISFNKTTGNLLAYAKYQSEATALAVAQFQWGSGFGTASELKMAQDDIFRMKSNSLIKINPEVPGFYRIFGSKNNSAAYDYFLKRVQYVDRLNVDDETIRAVNASVPLYNQSHTRAIINYMNRVQELFQQWAVQIWPNPNPVQIQKLNEFEPDLMFSGKAIAQPSFGRSLIQVTQNYFQGVSWIERMGFLIHEARHSDCVMVPDESKNLQVAETNVLKTRDLLAQITQQLSGKTLSTEEKQHHAKKYNETYANHIQAYQVYSELQKKMLTDPRCGQTHVLCPAGLTENGKASVLAGTNSCDPNIWGAYGIQAIYLKGIADSCANCDTETKQMLTVSIADMMGRVLDLSDLKKNQIRPDLGSGSTSPPRSLLIHGDYK